jgi:chromosome segregation ATPase
MTQTYNLAEGLPAPKRLKSHYQVDYDAFKPGSIIRCKLSNFMSYTLTEFHFGPKMNLIIGPNGSGKSTFVCAVCLGLGGKLSNLGKESMTTDAFIKDNQNEAIIELEIKNFNESSKNSFIITSKLIRNSKTKWEIDHKLSNETEIKKLLKNFNIQLDNLCQFLPQDRVSKFADLKPEDLLKEIERSYGNGELLEQHNLINQLQIVIFNEQKKLNEIEKSLLDFKTQNESLKESVEKHRQYLKLQKDLEKTELIRPYVEYQDKKLYRDNCYESFETEKNDYKLFIERVKPIEIALNNSDANFQETTEYHKDLESKDLKYSKEIDNINKKIENIDNKIGKFFSEMKDYDLKINEAKNDYFRIKDEYKKIDDDLQRIGIPDKDEIIKWKEDRKILKEEIMEIEDSITKIKSKLNAGQRKSDSYQNNIINEQKRLNSKDRLNTLDPNKYKITIQAVKYLRQLKDNDLDSTLKYFEPALIKLNVKDKSIAPIIETLVPFSHLNAVVVPSKEDYNQLSKYLYDEKKCMVSMRTLGNKFNVDQDRISRDTIIRLGFDGFITDFLSGPEEVIQMLCENVYLHKIPVSIKGLSHSQKDFISKEIEKGLDLIKYVSYDEIYTMNRSNFGRRQVTTNIKSFKLKSYIFDSGLSDEQKNEINNRINELKESLNENKKDNIEFNNELNIKKKEYDDKAKEFEDIEAAIKRSIEVGKTVVKLEKKKELLSNRMAAKKKTFKELKHNNSLENRNKFFDKINLLLQEKLDLESNNKKEIIIKKVLNDDELLKLRIRLIEENNKVKSIEKLNQSIKIEKDERHQKLKQLKLEFKKANETYNETYNLYKSKVSELSDEDKADMSIIIKEMAENGTLNHEVLNTKIKQIQSQIKLNSRSDGENSIRKLQDNEETIEKLQGLIPKLEESIEIHNKEIQESCKTWENELDKIVVIISNDFGENMSKIASGGSVVLDKSEDDYSKWKLIIKVSFRDNEQLTDFNGAQHSGGEKSTTTAVFLNSLQGLTNTPFRVVDEINQGMDAKNERRAHELIVRKATTSKSSQYFLITPKLLSGLYYGDGSTMSVHCIFAGRWLPRCTDDNSYLEMGISGQYIPGN